MELSVRFELTTYALQIRRSTDWATIAWWPAYRFMKPMLLEESQAGNGGETEIRTLGSFESLVFKTSSLNHSDISPNQVFTYFYNHIEMVALATISIHFRGDG